MAKARAKGRPITPLELSGEERAYLERQVRRHRVARSLSERCRIILRCADGLPSKSIAAELGLHEHTVGKWRRRFLKDRSDGLLDEARPGRPRTIDDDQVAAVIERTLRTTPADATHWSIRSMAAETGFSHTTIRRMWAAFGLQPHRSQTFKLSDDPLSSTRCGISSAFTSRRPTARLSSASTRKARSRLWIVNSRSCR
jgi:transposase